MTPNSSTGYTPFFLLFRAEVVLPFDVRYCAPHVTAYIEEDATKAAKDAQDLLDKARDIALARAAVCQQSLRNYHNRRVCGRSFEPGTWCSASVKKAQRNWSCHGKDHTLSTRSSPAGHIDSATSRQQQTRRTRGMQHT
jgi:hypothetical protein